MKGSELVKDALQNFLFFFFLQNYFFSSSFFFLAISKLWTGRIQTLLTQGYCVVTSPSLNLVFHHKHEQIYQCNS